MRGGQGVTQRCRYGVVQAVIHSFVAALLAKVFALGFSTVIAQRASYPFIQGQVKASDRLHTQSRIPLIQLAGIGIARFIDLFIITELQTGGLCQLLEERKLHPYEIFLSLLLAFLQAYQKISLILH